VRNWTVKGIIFSLAVWALAVAAPASAQDSDGILISAGVGLLKFDHGVDASPGFSGAVSKTIKTLGPQMKLAVVGDVARYSDKGYRNLLYQGGLRVTASRLTRVQPFGQFLAGVEQSSFGDQKATNAVFTGGAGVDVLLNEVLRVRAQADIPVVKYEDGRDTGRRFFVGLAFTIGGQ